MPKFLDNIEFWTQGYEEEGFKVEPISIIIIDGMGQEETIKLEIPETTITLESENPEQKMITDISRDIIKEKEIGVYQITQFTKSGIQAIQNRIKDGLEYFKELNLENGKDDSVLVQTKDSNHSFKVMTDGRVKVYGEPIESDDVLRLKELSILTQAQVDSLF